MPSKGVQDRVFLAAPTIWAAFAYSAFVSEATRRLFPEGEARLHERSPEERAAKPRFLTPAQLMRANGERLCVLRDRMVAADRALEEERRALDEERRRRDGLAKKLYRQVVWARNKFEDRVGRRRVTSRLGIAGETPRDPDAVLKVAQGAVGAMLAPHASLPEPMSGEVVAVRVVADHLTADCDALAASLETIELRESGEKAAVSVREERIAEFDEQRGNLGRFLERLLDFVEMPTLAATVRPELEGTGRRGRPSKKRPRDLFPDLVEAALALDPGAGLTLEEIRDLVPRRPVEYRRLEDVPPAGEVWKGRS